MVFLIRIQGNEFLWGQTFLSKFLCFSLENYFRTLSTINTTCFDCDHENSSIFQEPLTVHSDDSCLIRLSDISEYEIDHFYQKPVVLRFSSVFDDRNDVVSLLSHRDQVSSASSRELNGVKDSLRPDYIAYMGTSSSTGSSKI